MVGRDAAEAARAAVARPSTGGPRPTPRTAGSSWPTPSSSSGWLDGDLVLADEVLTPDSSRFWPADEWQPGARRRASTSSRFGTSCASSGWDQRPPPPPSAAQTVAATRARYIEAYERLSGRPFAAWPGPPTA